jgi:hypothetical protein
MAKKHTSPEVEEIRKCIISLDEYERSLPGYRGFRYYAGRWAFGITATVVVLAFSGYLPIAFHMVKMLLASLL